MSNFLKLQTDVLDLAVINELIGHESCGGLSFFVGTTRDNFENKKVSALQPRAKYIVSLANNIKYLSLL